MNKLFKVKKRLAIVNLELKILKEFAKIIYARSKGDNVLGLKAFMRSQTLLYQLDLVKASTPIKSDSKTKVLDICVGDNMLSKEQISSLANSVNEC
jgi:hypothetical protein